MTMYLQPEGDGTRVIMIEDPASPLLNVLIGPLGHAVIKLRNVESLRRAAPAVTRALVAAGADVLSIAQSRHTLEDVYLELVGDDGGRSR